jgi:hypothetical protein
MLLTIVISPFGVILMALDFKEIANIYTINYLKMPFFGYPSLREKAPKRVEVKYFIDDTIAFLVKEMGVTKLEYCRTLLNSRSSTFRRWFVVGNDLIYKKKTSI